MTGEDGSASLEFITVGMILLLPLVYLVIALSSLQAAAFAAEGAARQASRVFVQAEDKDAAQAAATRAVEFALLDYGLERAAVDTGLSCEPEPRDCLRRRGTVTVTVRILVPMPLVPPMLDLSVPLSVPIESSSTQTVPRFRGDG